jgi:hypothetical protein
VSATDTSNLSKAISVHRLEGRRSIGTAAIVESLHTDFDLSYERIADIAGVSLAGLRRWRERNMGDRAVFECLLRYAEKLVSGNTPELSGMTAIPHTAQPDSNRQNSPSPETRQALPLSIADAKQGLSLMFGVDPAMIEIVIKG